MLFVFQAHMDTILPSSINGCLFLSTEVQSENLFFFICGEQIAQKLCPIWCGQKYSCIHVVHTKVVNFQMSCKSFIILVQAGNQQCQHSIFLQVTALLKRKKINYYVEVVWKDVLRSTAFLTANAICFMSAFCSWRFALHYIHLLVVNSFLTQYMCTTLLRFQSDFKQYPVFNRHVYFYSV